MPAQEKLSRTEQILAYLIGGGIALAVLALFLYGLGVVDTDYAMSILLVGLAVIVIGIVAWLYLLRPWKSFDDLTTPYYTGHADAHDDAHAHSQHDDATQETARATATAVAEPVAESAAKPAAKVATKVVAEPVAEPVTKAGPVMAESAEPDDLTLIEGVGPKSAEALAASGVTTFKVMAGMTPAALEDAVKSRKVRLVGSTETWPAQAELAASGDLAGLEALKARIKGGLLHDDLTQIEGIGPKAQEALYDAGFRTYASLAAAEVEALRGVLDAARLKLLAPDTWPQQATLIVQGDLDGLKALQDDLKGGRT